MTDNPTLPQPDPLTREMIGEVIDMGARAKGWLRKLPWAEAEAGMREVDEMIATVSECLPGGYIDRCEGCEKPLGADDPYHRDDDGCAICPGCMPGNGALRVVETEQEPEPA